MDLLNYIENADTFEAVCDLMREANIAVKEDADFPNLYMLVYDRETVTDQFRDCRDLVEAPELERNRMRGPTTYQVGHEVGEPMQANNLDDGVLVDVDNGKDRAYPEEVRHHEIPDVEDMRLQVLTV